MNNIISYLFKTLFLVIFSIIVIFFYYNIASFHLEKFDWYFWYIILILIVYGVYKVINFISNKDYVSFSRAKIFWFFLIHLFILSCLFFSLNWGNFGYWMILFFKIVFYLLLPIFIFILSWSFWNKILNYIEWFKKESSTFQFLMSIWFWFFSFLTLVSISWFFGFYTLLSVLLIIWLLLVISYKEFLKWLKFIYNHKFVIKDHYYNSEADSLYTFFQKLNPKLLSTEFLFIVITFLISVNFISITRPMPIWWDDLWVYMNFPNIMAFSWNINELWWMISWQVFTWIWYLFGSPTQAFFLNSFAWVMAVIVVIVSLNSLLKIWKETFVNIPFLLWALFLAMPMVIFQLAKDMKLDPGLFFVSAIIIYTVIYLFKKYLWFKDDEVDSKDPQKDIFAKKEYLIYMFIIWILVWFAFGIKFTTLMLISWIIWIIFYAKLWLSWFFAYLSIYIWIFTKLGLWDMMNVVYPKNDIQFRNDIFLISIMIFITLMWYAIYKYKAIEFKKFLYVLLIFLVWIWVWVAPWALKNIYTAWNMSISSILNWKWEWFNIDYTKILSKEEKEIIDQKYSVQSINESGTTINEDLWRYFWYEKWINNYLKLPYNLTMQTNQRGEYTDITFIFLALIPALLLFLWYKRQYYVLWTFVISSIPLIFFFVPWINTYFTNIFSSILLPNWYIIILLFFLLPFIYLMYVLDNSKASVIFRLNLVFAFFYIFLWTISAFWIVWYGISMYYSLFIAIALWWYYISSYNSNDEDKNIVVKFFGSFIFLWVFLTYFFMSSFPHWFNNLKSSSYAEFKLSQLDTYNAIFASHPDYYDILLELNLTPEWRQNLYNWVSSTNSKELDTLLNSNNISDFNSYVWVLKEISNIDDTSKVSKELSQEALNKLSNIYKNVLYPNKEYKNNTWIYRIWTFLKYFIIDNHKRFLDDSLVFEFGKYFYDEKNVDSAIEKMKKMWVWYFLVDLNRATIDRDPRHDLTKRFESLLHSFTSDKLEVISTDSTCLKIALEDYKKSDKSPESLEQYITIAWVNYESYKIVDDKEQTINRWEKQLACYNHILSLMKDNKINEKDYSYLLPIAQYINTNQANFKSQEDLLRFFQSYVSHGWLVLFRIK